ncbi:class I SAM-dependent methyltransferase [bacterium]|nr:class I SAM-dependent methyltransferase [bacterium]
MSFKLDIQRTIENRQKLLNNRNLLYWYQILFETQFKAIMNFSNLNVIEIGSGTSPVKNFYPSVITTDILPMDHLDHVFDCHDIDRFEKIQDESIDIITMTNVMHHLGKPVDFLLKASKKLKNDGVIFITEPYMSFFSYILYKLLHREPIDYSITKPELSGIRGPLSSANIALSYKLFFSRKDWILPLHEKYSIDSREIRYYTFLSYFLTGGISSRVPIPYGIYKLLFKIDLYISHLLPRVCASFFTIKLKKNADETR